MKDNQVAYLRPAGQAVFKDNGLIKFGETLRTWDGKPAKGYGLIGAPLSKPSISHSGAAFAPEVIRSIFKNTATYAIEEDIDLLHTPIVDFGDVLMHVTDLQESHNRIQAAVKEVMEKNPEIIPIILGGDHSITCPSFKGFKEAKGGTIGVIQFDAHHDVRNREDGGPSNGTPFRGLIESGALKPEHLVQIGIRNFSNSRTYSDYAANRGVTIFTMKNVRDKGILALVQESYQKLAGQVDEIYLSVDIDVLDQAFAPGCPAIGPGGMTNDDLFAGVKWLSAQEKTRAIDIVEIDPKQDFRDMTSRVGTFVILMFILGKESSR
ncbi:MAG: formimidoylglutamase [Tuberibacillus sp.]